jgi:hypothetical protein
MLRWSCVELELEAQGGRMLPRCQGASCPVCLDARVPKLIPPGPGATEGHRSDVNHNIVCMQCSSADSPQTEARCVRVRSVVDLRLLLIYFRYLCASLGSLATVLAPSGTRPRFTTPYRRRAPPAPQ